MEILKNVEQISLGEFQGREFHRQKFTIKSAITLEKTTLHFFETPKNIISRPFNLKEKLRRSKKPQQNKPFSHSTERRHAKNGSKNPTNRDPRSYSHGHIAIDMSRPPRDRSHRRAAGYGRNSQALGPAAGPPRRDRLRFRSAGRRLVAPRHLGRSKFRQFRASQDESHRPRQAAA